MKWSLVPMGSIGFEGRDMPPGERGSSLEDLYFEGERRAPYLWRFAALTVFTSSRAWAEERAHRSTQRPA